MTPVTFDLKRWGHFFILKYTLSLIVYLWKILDLLSKRMDFMWILFDFMYLKYDPSERWP
jgi:hypothetical protein